MWKEDFLFSKEKFATLKNVVSKKSFSKMLSEFLAVMPNNFDHFFFILNFPLLPPTLSLCLHLFAWVCVCVRLRACVCLCVRACVWTLKVEITFQKHFQFNLPLNLVPTSRENGLKKFFFFIFPPQRKSIKDSFRLFDPLRAFRLLENSLNLLSSLWFWMNISWILDRFFVPTHLFKAVFFNIFEPFWNKTISRYSYTPQNDILKHPKLYNVKRE